MHGALENLPIPVGGLTSQWPVITRHLQTEKLGVGGSRRGVVAELLPWTPCALLTRAKLSPVGFGLYSLLSVM